MISLMSPLLKMKNLTLLSTGCLMLFFSGMAMADSGLTLGNMASQVTSSFASITRLITGGSYIAGLGFAIGAIMKFKQHKDNPTQIPVGTPIALLFISAALLYFPSILTTTGYTLFSGGGTVAGPSGIIFGTP